MGRLDGKVAIVTGGARGIGLAAGERFLAEGARVLLVDRDAADVREAAANLGSDDVAAFPADVSDAARVQAAVADAVERFGGVDVLIANAGIGGDVAPLVEQTEANFDAVWAVNVKGVWNCLRHAAPEMARRGGGSVVMTSSVAGLSGFRGLGVYSVSKHAVVGLMRTAALELARDGIRVNTVHPGPVETRMMAGLSDSADDPADYAAGVLSTIPLRRFGAPSEIASLMLFLASDESGWCTGQTWVADGGMLGR